MPPMKRHVLVALAALIPLATPSRAEDGGFRAGAAMSNITPLMGVPLDGTIMQIGPAKHVHDELWARCLAFDDGQSRLALVVVDCTMVSREVFDAAKRQIELETGIPPDRVCISATHSHSTPRALVGLVDDRLHRGYLDFLANRVADGVRRAVNNLAPAEIGWGGFEEPRFVHNRRWFIDPALWATNANPFGDTGERVKMNPGREGLAKPAGPVDPECFVVSVRHRDGRPIAALGAYGLHYIGGVPGGTVSADYFGVFAKRLRENLGAADLDPPFVGLMANGTSGDINAVDYSAPAERFPPYERMNFVGAELARQAAEAIGRFEHRHAGVTLAAASA